MIFTPACIRHSGRIDKITDNTVTSEIVYGERKGGEGRDD